MKRKVIWLLFFAGVFLSAGFDSKTAARFEGNWDLLSVSCEGTFMLDGKPVDLSMKKDAENFGMLMINDGYFMFTGQGFIDDETAPNYGYGTYTLEDNILTEHVIFHVDKNLLGGKSPSFEIIVEGDRLVVKGPLKTGEFKDVTFEITETFIRK